MDLYSDENVSIRVIGEQKGKGVFAKKCFIKGTTIFAEEPFICTQYVENQKLGIPVCDFCLKSLETVEKTI